MPREAGYVPASSLLDVSLEIKRGDSEAQYDYTPTRHAVLRAELPLLCSAGRGGGSALAKDPREVRRGPETTNGGATVKAISHW